MSVLILAYPIMFMLIHLLTNVFHVSTSICEIVDISSKPFMPMLPRIILQELMVGVRQLIADLMRVPCTVSGSSQFFPICIRTLFL